PLIQMRTEPPDPGQLVVPLLAPDGLPVREVAGENAEAADRGGDETGLIVRDRIGHPDRDVLERTPAQDRDAVVGPLAMKRHLIAGRGDLGGGKLLVRDLELLEADD